MALMISKNQPSISDEEENTSFSNRDGSEPLGSVTSHIYLKSSAKSLDKSIVLGRIRRHKTKNKVKNGFKAFVAPNTANIEEKWLELGDTFTSP
ncbi:hypothetical protein OROHE_002363 [Orobanche hederae]